MQPEATWTIGLGASARAHELAGVLAGILERRWRAQGGARAGFATPLPVPLVRQFSSLEELAGLPTACGVVLDFEHVDPAQIDGLHQVLAALLPRELLLLGSSAKRPFARTLLAAGAQWAEDSSASVEILSAWLRPAAPGEHRPVREASVQALFQSDPFARARARVLINQKTQGLAAVLQDSSASTRALQRLQRVLGAQAVLEGDELSVPTRRLDWSALALDRLDQLRWLGPDQGQLLVRPSGVLEIFGDEALLAAAFDSLVLAVWHAAGARATLWVHLLQLGPIDSTAGQSVRLCLATDPAPAPSPTAEWIRALAAQQDEITELELWAAAAILEVHAARWSSGEWEQLPCLQLDFPAAPAAENSS